MERHPGRVTINSDLKHVGPLDLRLKLERHRDVDALKLVLVRRDRRAPDVEVALNLLEHPTSRGHSCDAQLVHRLRIDFVG